eukprot:g18942.t1
MMLQLLQAALGKAWFGIPETAGTYPFEPLGYILPVRYAFILDENSEERMEGWLGGKMWWKSWLSLQTNPTMMLSLPSNKQFDRVEYDEKAPVCYSATYPLRLKRGQCGYVDPEKIKSENLQQTRRETVGRCEVYVDQGVENRLPLCGHCTSKYLAWCQTQTKAIQPKDMPSPQKAK